MDQFKDIDPFIKFNTWFMNVCNLKDMKYGEPNAVCLTTCVNNKPSSRMVLLKKYDRNGFSFFTNSVSRKGQELTANPNAAMLFYWSFFNRQIRIEGQVKMLPIEYAEDSWNSRPLDIRIGPAISVQSSIIPSRKYLEDKRNQLDLLVLEKGEQAIKRLESWFGYILVPEYFEFFKAKNDGINDRIAYKLESNNEWKQFRLSS